MFFSSVWNPTATIANYEKSKLFNKVFRLWGTYYAIVDWVVNEYKIKGVTKMGIAHIQDSGWTQVHGWTNGSDVFEKVADLKEVKTFEAIGEYDDKVYSGKQQSEIKSEDLLRLFATLESNPCIVLGKVFCLLKKIEKMKKKSNIQIINSS